MATENPNSDQRIADAIRSMADEDGRLSSPPSNLWGRIERAIEPDGQAASDLVDPPDELWGRIADAVRSDGGPQVTVLRRRSRTLRTLGLLAAAVIVLAAIAATALLVGRSGTGPTEELVAEASLSGKGLDPGGTATGAAELIEDPSGWKVALQVDALPSPPAGSYYEAWLLGAGPDQVQSLGALDGTDRFAVPSGLAIEDYPLVDVSIEPIDGNPAHSSKSVLRGELQKT